MTQNEFIVFFNRMIRLSTETSFSKKKKFIYIIMKRFCTSLQADEVHTALVVGQGYFFRHSANERSHSHKR